MTFASDDAIARDLFNAREGIGKILRRWFEQDLGDYGAALGIDRHTAVVLGDRGDSVAQGNRSRGGRALETLVFDGFDKACAGRAQFIRGWKAPGFRNRKMDGYLDAPRLIWVASVTRSARERKAGTWNDEYAHCLKHAAELGKPLRFLGITDDVDAKDVENLRGKVQRGVEVIWLHNQNLVRALVTDIRASVQ